MADQTSNGNGFTTKELLLRIWDEVKDHRRETGQRFDGIEGRIDSLESDRDKSFWPRKYGGVLLTALLTGVVGALLGAASLR